MTVAIGDHALLADGRTAALVDPDGNVAWLCWPRVDSMPCLLAILDEARGGRFSLRPSDPDARVVGRGYIAGSLVLRTVWESQGLQLVVEDALTWDGPPRLIRSARCDRGAIEVTGRFAPAFNAGRMAATWQLHERQAVARAGGIALAVTATAPWSAVGGGEVRCLATATPGAPAALVLSAPEAVGAAPPGVALAATHAAWRRLRPPLGTRPSPLAERVLGETATRELLALSGCVLVGLRNRGGGIVAAPTTSLPQWPASSRTWDYRYAWLRDSSLAAGAMARLGLLREAHELGSFIGGVAGEEGPRALVRVDGGPAPPETVLDHLSGHGGARPVRVGNAAAAQPQLDVCGEVIELASTLAGLDALPESLREAVPRLAGWIVAHWREPDHGIWEIRGEPRHYTHSRLLAWFGLGEAVALAGRGQVTGDVAAWRRCGAALAGAIRRSASKAGVLPLHEGGGGADAALALAPLLGFLPPQDAGALATLAAITSRLGHGGLMDRHEGRPDGLAAPCGPFLFPTHWTAMALERCGGDGSAHFAAAAAARGSTGLFGEVADPEGGTPLGNYPQVQSHAAFILAATRGHA